MTDQETLSLTFECGDLNRTLTIREYLKELLLTLWQEGEGFSGKRPFGNSGWQYDVYKPLVMAKVVAGEIDDDGFIDSVDSKAADLCIERLIGAL